MFILCWLSDLQHPLVESTLTPQNSTAILALTSLILSSSSLPLSWNLTLCTVSIFVLDLSLQVLQSMCLPQALKSGCISKLPRKLLGNYIVPGGIPRNSHLAYSLRSRASIVWKLPPVILMCSSLGNHVSDISLWVRILLPSLISYDPLGKSFSFFISDL